MVSYKKLGLVNTKKMFAKAVKGRDDLARITNTPVVSAAPSRRGHL